MNQTNDVDPAPVERLVIPRKCKDIADLPILEFIAGFNGEWCFVFGRETSERSVFWAMPEGTPWKLGLAKMRMLIRRGLVDGCPCGCRGDFTITDKGLAFIESQAG